MKKTSYKACKPSLRGKGCCLFIWCSLFVVLLRVVVVACHVDHAVLALPSGRGWDELKESLKTSWIFLEMNNNNSWQKWKWLKDKIMLGRWEWSQWQCKIGELVSPLLQRVFKGTSHSSKWNSKWKLKRESVSWIWREKWNTLFPSGFLNLELDSVFYQTEVVQSIKIGKVGGKR